MKLGKARELPIASKSFIYKMPAKRKNPSQRAGNAKRQKPDKDKSSVKQKAVVKSSKSDDTAAKRPAATPSFSLGDLITNATWKTALSEELDKEYVKEIESKLTAHYKNGDSIFPPKDLIFNALNMTALDKIKVVILGQDPYHDDGQAMGLSFSVPKGVKIPPSLVNIYKELDKDSDIKGFKMPNHGCLDSWATNGVLLLNATLTVTAHQPNSHAKYGWQKLTDAIIKLVSEECAGVVFILWGGFAHKKEKLIDQKKHAVIKTAHPSPLSFGKFINCKCFSNANKKLKEFKKSPVDWAL